jgi:hypothetical protein
MLAHGNWLIQGEEEKRTQPSTAMRKPRLFSSGGIAVMVRAVLKTVVVLERIVQV